MKLQLIITLLLLSVILNATSINETPKSDIESNDKTYSIDSLITLRTYKVNTIETFFEFQVDSIKAFKDRIYSIFLVQENKGEFLAGFLLYSHDESVMSKSVPKYVVIGAKDLSIFKNWKINVKTRGKLDRINEKIFCLYEILENDSMLLIKPKKNSLNQEHSCDNIENKILSSNNDVVANYSTNSHNQYQSKERGTSIFDDNEKLPLSHVSMKERLVKYNEEKSGNNLYGMGWNNAINIVDLLGLRLVPAGTIEGPDEIEELETTVWIADDKFPENISFKCTVSDVPSPKYMGLFDLSNDLSRDYSIFRGKRSFTITTSQTCINSLVDSISHSWSFSYGVETEYKEVIRHKTSMNIFSFCPYSCIRQTPYEKYGYVYVGRNELSGELGVGCVTQDICADLKSLKRTGVLTRTRGKPVGNYKLTGGAYGTSNNLELLVQVADCELEEQFNNLLKDLSILREKESK